MALLLMIALMSASMALVDSASNKTNCDIIHRNISLCAQTSCLPSISPCTMLCGLTTQYDVCLQVCDSSNCNALECRASKRCLQKYVLNTFGSMICDAKECIQTCILGYCSSMMCPKTVTSCEQESGSKMTCEADACKQSCSKKDCQMNCPIGGSNCTQVARKGGAAMECDRGVCEQHCVSRGKCNMSCSSNLTTGGCQQVCNESKCESMICNATNCKQTCLHGECNMACPLGEKNCTQVAQVGNVTMRCDGDVCKQVCTSGDCDMICSASVKECHQVCLKGLCIVKCDAEQCKLDCPSGSCFSIRPTPPTTSIAITTANTIKRSCATLKTGVSVFAVLLLALILF